MESPNTVLFLYGSLKRGHSNHRLIADQQYLGDAVTEPRYRIIELGQYGGLICDDADGLAGEGKLLGGGAWCLAGLGDFQTGGGGWARSPGRVAGREGAEAYFWIGEVPANVRSGDVWPFT